MSRYEVRRETVITASPARVHALIDSFHEWPRWSPWEGVDPNLAREYSGPETGPGAHYEWEGNRKAGRGSMTILASSPQRIDLVVEFEKPFTATNPTSFTIEPTPEGHTRVAWIMTGVHTGFAAIVFRFVSMDRFLGPDFERGLADLKRAAEAPADS